MIQVYRPALWMMFGILIVVGTYVVFDMTHAFYKASLTGERYFREQRYASALPYLLDAYRLRPKDKNIAWRLVWTYVRLNRKGEGHRLLEEMNNRSPADPKVSESLGDMAFTQNAYVLAQAYYERALTRKPSITLRSKYVKVLLAEKKYAEALYQMDILLSTDSDNQDLKYQHAQVVAALGDHERAVRELEALEDEGYKNKEALTMLGDQLRLLGRDQEALAIYQEVQNGK